MAIEMWWVKQMRSNVLSQVAQELASAETHEKDWH
jgi:hypothetical protein